MGYSVPQLVSLRVPPNQHQRHASPLYVVRLETRLPAASTMGVYAQGGPRPRGFMPKGVRRPRGSAPKGVRRSATDKQSPLHW